MKIPNRLKTTRLVNSQDLQKKYEVNRSTIWRWVSNGSLPKPVSVMNGSPRWDEEQIALIERELLDAQSIQQKFKISPSTLYRDVRRGWFPKPAKRFGKLTWTKGQISRYEDQVKAKTLRLKYEWKVFEKKYRAAGCPYGNSHDALWRWIKERSSVPFGVRPRSPSMRANWETWIKKTAAGDHFCEAHSEKKKTGRQHNAELEELLTLAEVARYVQVSERTIYRLCAAGYIGVYRADFGDCRRWRVTRSELKRYLEPEEPKFRLKSGIVKTAGGN